MMLLETKPDKFRLTAETIADELLLDDLFQSLKEKHVKHLQMCGKETYLPACLIIHHIT